MTTTTAGVIFVLSLVVALVAAYKPFGDHMFRVVSGTRQSRVERGIYRLVGVNPQFQEGRPLHYTLSIESRLADLLRQGVAAYRMPKQIEERLQRFELEKREKR